MNIGSYTFAEYKEKAAAFHGYPSPGILVGGYMVAMAQRALPQGTLFEAVVETHKCLPDAVQLLTLCSTGNNWMKIVNLGKYAVSLFDKYTGEGVRVYVDAEKLEGWPEIRGWLLKEKPKAAQDVDLLLREIEEAGESILGIQHIRIRPRFLAHKHMQGIGVCPRCHEPYPADDGVICRSCQGEAPYVEHAAPAACQTASSGAVAAPHPGVRLLPAEEAVGRKAFHDMTQIVPGASKGAAFTAGQTLSVGDVCRLQQMGRFTVAVEDAEQSWDRVHENRAAEAFAAHMAGQGVVCEGPPREGKIHLSAAERGLLCVDRQRLLAFNMLGDVMCAVRQDGSVVEKGAAFGATRCIPLALSADRFSLALDILSAPLFSVAPLRAARVGILVTGTEVFKGLVEDRFIPIISAKVQAYDCSVARTDIVPDDRAHLLDGIAAMRAAGVDLLVTTGGLSVDPDDITRAALEEAGLVQTLYGAPVLPGAMSLSGWMGLERALPDAPENRHALPLHQPRNGEMQVIGVPACALYFKTTLFDLLLPRALAGRILTRRELAELGEGGFCMNCKSCTWPKCFLNK